MKLSCPGGRRGGRGGGVGVVAGGPGVPWPRSCVGVALALCGVLCGAVASTDSPRLCPLLGAVSYVHHRYLCVEARLCE